MTKKPLRTLLQSSKPYLLLALINLFFFLIPLSLNFYVDDVKVEDTAQKIANVASSTGLEKNSVAIRLRSPNAGESDSGGNRFGVSVNSYNGLFPNPLQLTDGLINEELSFSYGDLQLDEIGYTITSGIFSNHQGVRGRLFDQYEMYIYSDKSNTDYSGCNNFCYITERTARKIMEANPSLTSYDDVINTALTVKYKDITHKWKISNVIMDKESFYSQMSGIYGDFILAYTHLPGGLGHNVDLTAYFGSNTYLNINKMESLFSLDSPTYTVYRGNLGNADASTLDELDTFFNGFAYNETTKVLYYVEIGVAALLNSLCAWLFLRKRNALKLVPMLGGITGSLILAYVPFWAVYKATSNVHFLSHMGVLGLLVAYAVAILVTVFLWVLRKKEAQ